jgi:hypothetical protein
VDRVHACRCTLTDWDGFREFLSSYCWQSSYTTTDKHFKDICEAIQLGSEMFTPAKKIFVKTSSPPCYSQHQRNSRHTRSGGETQQSRIITVIALPETQQKPPSFAARNHSCSEKIATDGLNKNFWSSVGNVFGKHSSTIACIEHNGTKYFNDSDKAEVLAAKFANDCHLPDSSSPGPPDFPPLINSILSRVSFPSDLMSHLLSQLRDELELGRTNWDELG